MGYNLLSFVALFSATLILTTGSGLLGSFLSLRMTVGGLDSRFIGLIMSCFYLGLIFGSAACRPIIRRVGHIRALAVFAAINTATVLLQSLIFTPWSWAIFRVLTGFAVMGIYMVVESWLSAHTGPENRGRVFAIYMACTFLGLGGGQFLLQLYPVEGPELFSLTAVFLVLCLLPVALTRSPSPPIPAVHSFSVRTLLQLAPFAVLGCVCSGLATGTFFALGPSFALQVGLDAADVAQFMGLTILSGLLFQWPVGWFSDRYNRLTLLALLGLGLPLACLAMAVFTGKSTTAFTLASMGIGGLIFSLYPVSVAHANDHIKTDDLVGVSSMLLLMYSLGAWVGPLGASLLMSWLGASGFYVFIALCGALVGTSAFLRRHVGAIAVAEKTPYLAMPRTSPVINELDPRVELQPDSPEPSSHTS